VELRGFETPDLLHAITRQHIHRRASAQVTILPRPLGSTCVRACCGTFPARASPSSSVAIRAAGGDEWAVVNEPGPLLKSVYAGFPGMCFIRLLTSVSSCLPAQAEAIRQIATAMMPGISVSHTASEILTLKMTTTRTTA
jgi:hypothetical protein